jgi:hypothetical protein
MKVNLRPSILGLCGQCAFMRPMQNDRGSKFYLCERSATDPNFPKYPRLPVSECAGYLARVVPTVASSEDVK